MPREKKGKQNTDFTHVRHEREMLKQTVYMSIPKQRECISTKSWLILPPSDANTEYDRYTKVEHPFMSREFALYKPTSKNDVLDQKTMRMIREG